MNEKAEINLLLERYYDNLTFEANKVPFPFIVDEFTLNLTKKRLKDFIVAIDDGCTIRPVEVCNLNNIFKKLSKYGDLSIEELYQMEKYLLALEEMQNGLKGREEYEVKELYLDLISFPNIRQRLSLSITPDFEISSDASSTLSSIRKTIARLKASMDSVAKAAQKKYENYLSDKNITFRNGYSTIAVSSTNKNKVDGVLANTSSTGSTSYMIPNEVLALSNKIAEEEEKEHEEIRRIIHSLSNSLSEHYEELVKVYDVALIIDRTYGAVYFGHTYKGCVASIDKEIFLDDLAHPLIPINKVVTNDLSLNDEKGKILLISGPNAGGKTVFLKSLQIAAILNQAGLLVPASFAKLPIFDNVFFLSGDNQSVLDNLSTFSSHVSELKSIEENMSKESLVIIDEIGQGTSPLEGSALGVAFIKKAQRIGSYLIMTSHYEDLKDYCLEHDEIISAKMVFDEENLEPLFKINYGVAGHSFGLAVAKKMGLSQEVIFDAESFVAEKRNDPLKHNLDILNKRILEVEATKEKLQSQKDELERLTNKRLRAIESVQKQREVLKEREDELVEQAVEERLKEIDKIWNKDSSLGNFAKVSKIKGDLKKTIKPIEEEKTKPSKKKEFSIGDNVRILLTGQEGVIKEKRGQRYKVDAKGLTVTVSYENLEFIPKSASIKKAKPTNPIDRIFISRPNISMELNIIGLRAIDAEEKILQYLDSCILAHYHRVRIIHGVGTGALQKLTWRLLENNKNVESFSFGGEGEGGVGATVVYLK